MKSNKVSVSAGAVPISLQIYYALSFLTMTIGLAAVVIFVFMSYQNTNTLNVLTVGSSWL